MSDFESRYVSKGGSVIHFSWTASVFPEASLVYAIGRDKTELKRLEKIRNEEREKAVVDSKMHALGRMAAGVALFTRQFDLSNFELAVGIGW